MQCTMQKSIAPIRVCNIFDFEDAVDANGLEVFNKEELQETSISKIPITTRIGNYILRLKSV